ncbi:MAG TPA: polysaccharide deacetylase family protein [Cytophagaceae bacterium]|jgi:peptidoglycan/xylan/chitin deacetylase (PgdA/CDA1 family)|nr:polysaccharide deacetylase family protein [Cytophagaceae bacterium]
MLTYRNVRLAHALLSTAAIIGYFVYGSLFLIVVIGLALIYLACIAYGVFAVHSGFFLTLYSHADIKEKQIALTFDDGPSEHTVKVLDFLKNYNVKATFFLIGKQIESNSDVLKRIVEEGHQIGNHTYNHSKATGFYRPDQLHKELQATNSVVREQVGITMRLFRPPFGVTTPNLAKVIIQLKWDAIGWSVRSFDTTMKPVDLIIKRILKQVKPGAVILLHDNREKCMPILKVIVPDLLQQQYSFVTVGELFKIEAYEKN